MKRCKTCLEEIHSTPDGLQLDHADFCPERMKESITVIYQGNRHWLKHPDDPERPYHPITDGAVIDLEKNIRRYEQDWQNENHPTLR